MLALMMEGLCTSSVCVHMRTWVVVVGVVADGEER